MEPRLTKLNHPWTPVRAAKLNGQVERMNRTLTEVTVKRHHYASHQQLKKHVYHSVNAVNFAK